MHRVQSRIIDEYLGEQPIGTCMIVETGDQYHPYLAHTPTMRVPMTVSETDNAYTAMWALLTAIHRHNHTNDQKIESVLCAGFATGIGAVPYDKAAAHMAVAYRRFLASPQVIDWAYADERHAEVQRANRQQLIKLFQGVKADPDAVLADRNYRKPAQFHKLAFALQCQISIWFQPMSAGLFNAGAGHGMLNVTFAYEMQERGFGIDEIIEEVMTVHIDVLEGQLI